MSGGDALSLAKVTERTDHDAWIFVSWNCDDFRGGICLPIIREHSDCDSNDVCYVVKLSGHSHARRCGGLWPDDESLWMWEGRNFISAFSWRLVPPCGWKLLPVETSKPLFTLHQIVVRLQNYSFLSCCCTVARFVRMESSLRHWCCLWIPIRWFHLQHVKKNKGPCVSWNL